MAVPEFALTRAAALACFGTRLRTQLVLGWGVFHGLLVVHDAHIIG